MHARQNSLFWIEAEEFARSNFAEKAAENHPAKCVMATAAASGGQLVVAFQKQDYYLEYEFREDRDGFWDYQVWLRYATTCPSSRLITTLNRSEVGNCVLKETDDFFQKYRWEKIATIQVPKGNHTLGLILKTGVVHPDVIILTPDDTPIASGVIETNIKNNIKEIPVSTEPVTRNRLWLQHHRNGVPLGGLGTGKIEWCQDGGFANCSINNNQDAPIATLPGAFFIYREQVQGSPALVRILEHTGRALPEIESIQYHGLYPFVRINYADKALQGRLSAEAFSPLIPGQVNDSSLPVALFTFMLTNSGQWPIKAGMGFSFENVIGCGGLGRKLEWGPGTALRVDGESFWAWNNRTGNDQEPIQLRRGQGLHFTTHSRHDYDSSDGDYVVACAALPRVNVTLTRSYNVETDLPLLSARLNTEIPRELLAVSGSEGQIHPAGIVWAQTDLNPGESREIVFCLSWFFPVLRDCYGRDHSVHYATRFDSAAAVADYALERRQPFARDSFQVNDRIMRSSLPEWLSRKIINDLFPITTCSWFDKAGQFSINESPSFMHGCLGTIDQRTASQGVYTSLFPELDKNELSLFADFQHECGMISHDLGRGGVDRSHAGYHVWPDLVCSFIIETLRHMHATGDREFIQSIYPRVTKAINWVLTLDDDGDGIPDMKPGRGNTYDTSEWPGCSSFVGSLWIAALYAAADMARLAGQAQESPGFVKLAQKAADSMNHKLWNGRFYDNFKCDDPSRSDAKNCLLPQVAGEWALDLLDLPRGLPEDKVRSALLTIFDRNITGLNKTFKGPADETTPEGDPAGVGAGFLQYSWLYFGALAAYRGLEEEALYSWRQSYEQAWIINQQPWKTRLGGFALSGKFNGLPWYMTNTASWDILHALSGFAYSIPDQWIRIDHHLPASWRPALKQPWRFALPLFGSSFWLWMDYQEDANQMQFTFRWDRVFGKQPDFKWFRTTVRPSSASLN
ncbi:MAG: GH116 family glycosyl-hydrolase, partial [Kiritimatiellia bacterium]|nr:GH116 family glycosyl-hydrolase [Kiritimatiellia bacterium]